MKWTAVSHCFSYEVNCLLRVKVKFPHYYEISHTSFVLPVNFVFPAYLHAFQISQASQGLHISQSSHGSRVAKFTQVPEASKIYTSISNLLNFMSCISSSHKLFLFSKLPVALASKRYYQSDFAFSLVLKLMKLIFSDFWKIAVQAVLDVYRVVRIGCENWGIAWWSEEVKYSESRWIILRVMLCRERNEV